jgi:hypothetical protein
MSILTLATILHYILATISSLLLIILFITDYKRQRETDDDKAQQLEIQENSIIFDILIIITLSLFI